MCTKMSVQGNLLQPKIGNKLNVHQQKTCKVNYSKCIKWNTVQPLKSTRQLSTHQYGTISKIMWGSRGKKAMCKRMYIVCFVCMYLHRISLQKKKKKHNKFNNGSFVEELGD